MNAIAPIVEQDASEIMEAVLLAGDLSKLSPEERTNFYMSTCRSLGLNPLTRPFDYIRLSGREVLYAKRDCADQLRKLHRISLEIVDRKVTGDLLVVTVRATTPDGRSDEDMGVVSVKGLAGEALANAMLRGMTKAKRRVTLSICGLGMMDETEVRSALEAERQPADASIEVPKINMVRPPRSAQPPSPAAKPPLEVVIGDGWEPARFPRTRPGLTEALAFITGAVLDGKPGVVALNNGLLDTIADRMPELAAEIAELRASAAEAMAPKDEPEEGEGDGFVQRFVAGDDTDTFPGDIPPKP